MKRFAELYARYSETYFCCDSNVTTFVLEGLAKHKEEFGELLCPCIPMQERQQCDCMLFLQAENDFASSHQKL
jgi:ferredoxin-thioredoxin reductase catalytic chain